MICQKHYNKLKNSTNGVANLKQQDIANAGHEIGTHGFSHVPIYRQTPAEFRAELYRSIIMLEDLTGQPVYGHRAAFFSITANNSSWALPILAQAGLTYDTGIFLYPLFQFTEYSGQITSHVRRLSIWAGARGVIQSQ